MNLYSRGDFVSQLTSFWCIPASTQTMMNMMDGGRSDRTRALQARLYRVGDNLEEDGTFSDEREFDRWSGMGISEWAGLLNRYDYGPYGLTGYKSRQNALRNAALMMRKTGKPVGLVVWRGAHAWVMSGFTATAGSRAHPGLRGDLRPGPGPLVSARERLLGSLAPAQPAPLAERPGPGLPALWSARTPEPRA